MTMTLALFFLSNTAEERALARDLTHYLSEQARNEISR